MDKTCMGGGCSKCRAWKAIIIGVLVLANAYWVFLSWEYFIGILLVLGGILGLAMPSCPHCR